MDRRTLAQAFDRVRGVSQRLVLPLLPEDWRTQSMPDVSPPYWNLGHTSWFFLRNVLAPIGREAGDFPGFDYAFNSYYEGLGPRLPRHQRGSVAQPSTAATLAYRGAVNAAMRQAIVECSDAEWPQFARATEIGLQHEQQHQELLLTEVLHIRWSAPRELRLAYAPAAPPAENTADGAPLRPIEVRGGVVEIGHRDDGFCWDNELPVHRAAVGDFALADRLVTNREWLAFMADGGYAQPLLWLSNGWAAVQPRGWQAPLYWERDGSEWRHFTLRGDAPLPLDAPVCHVSFYEAEAFARWYGEQFASWRHARLPKENEWEHAARVHGYRTAAANLLDDEPLQSALQTRAAAGSGLRQLAGDAWEWTTSHYEGYPGYRPFAGALMEYNGKFMDNQRVLRGGSWATPRDHARVAYRNFWPADARFQATGVRLLRDG